MRLKMFSVEKAVILSVDFNMRIRGGKIFTEDGRFQQGDLTIADGKIIAVTLGEENTVVSGKQENVLDAENLYVLPGFVDIHMHGCMGVDFCDAKKEAFSTIENYQMQHGITTVFPATMTLPEEKLSEVFGAAAEYVKTSQYNVFSGVTMEGPFLSKEKKGAQEERYLCKPSEAFFDRLWKKSNGLICQVAVAPEEDGAKEFIREISPKTVVSVAHSIADYDTASGAFEKGATHVTHLFNGMNPFMHREPGIIGAALDNPNVFVELICDGVHIHPAVVRSVFKLFGAERVCMISDSLSATGMPDGEYILGGQRIFKNGERATLQDGTLAGSVCNLYDCFKKAVLEMHIPLEEAVLSCTKAPAKSLRLDEKYGIIKEGRNADLLIVDDNLDIKYIFKNGKMNLLQTIST